MEMPAGLDFQSEETDGSEGTAPIPSSFRYEESDDEIPAWVLADQSPTPRRHRKASQQCSERTTPRFQKSGPSNTLQGWLSTTPSPCTNSSKRYTVFTGQIKKVTRKGKGRASTPWNTSSHPNSPIPGPSGTTGSVSRNTNSVRSSPMPMGTQQPWWYRHMQRSPGPSSNTDSPPVLASGTEVVINFLIDTIFGDGQVCGGAVPVVTPQSQGFLNMMDTIVPPTGTSLLVDTIDRDDILKRMNNMTVASLKCLYEGQEPGSNLDALYDVFGGDKLGRDPHAADGALVTVDVDSFLALPKTLAFTKTGLNVCFYPSRSSNMASNIHLWCIIAPSEEHGRTRNIKVPYHTVPNTYFGRVSGFSECEIYAFFPHLYYNDRPTTFLTDDQIGRFMNIVLSAIRSTPEFGAGFHQHLPGTCEQAKLMSYAGSRETGVNEIETGPRQQALHYFLPAKGIEAMWSQVLTHLRNGENYDLADPVLLISAKNMKTMFREDSIDGLIDTFCQRWQQSFVSSAFLPQSTWIDVGKETISTSQHPEVYLWRSDCLQEKSTAFTMDVPRAGMKFSTFEWGQLAGVGNLTVESGRKHPLRLCGLIYSQFYSSTKEIFDAAKIYPFQDKVIEGLTIDASLQAEWKKLGHKGAKSWSQKQSKQAYVSSKARVGQSLQGAAGKSFGVREEHRMTMDLLLQLQRSMHDRGMRGHTLQTSTQCINRQKHIPFVVLDASDCIKYMTYNLEKYILGFEYSILKDDVISPASSQMALMFLEFIKSSFTASDMRRVKGMWNVQKLLPNGNIRYGMGVGRSMEERGYAFFYPERVHWGNWQFEVQIRENISFGLKRQVGNYTRAYKEATRALEFDAICSELCTWLAEEVGVSIDKQSPTSYTALQVVWKWLCEHFVSEFQQEVLKACQTDMLEEYTGVEVAGQPIGFCYKEIDALMEEPLAMVRDTSNGRTQTKTVVQRLEHLWAFDEQGQSDSGGMMGRKWDKKQYRLRYQTGVKIWNSKLACSGWEWNNLEFFKYFIRRCHIWPNSTTQKWFPLKFVPSSEDKRKQYVWCGVGGRGFHPNQNSTWEIGHIGDQLPGDPWLVDKRWLKMGVDEVKALCELCGGQQGSWLDLSREYEWYWNGSPVASARLRLSKGGAGTPVPLAEGHWN